MFSNFGKGNTNLKTSTNKSNNFNSNTKNDNVDNSNNELNKKISTQDISSKLSKVKLFCKLHNSEIGGVCENMECNSQRQLHCVKCMTDNSSCIKKDKHELLTFDEFVDKFFTKHIASFKSNYTYSKGLKNIESYISNETNYFIDFKNKFGNLNNLINDSFDALRRKIDDMNEKINNQIMDIADKEIQNFGIKYEKLKDMMNSDLIFDFDHLKCKEKMNKMPVESFNDAITKIKRTFNHIKNKDYSQLEERINIYMNVKFDGVSRILSHMEEIESSLFSKCEVLMNEISILFDENYTKKKEVIDKNTINSKKSKDKPSLHSIKNEEQEIKKNQENSSISENEDNDKDIIRDENDPSFKLQKLTIKKEFPIDYSVNSNFLDKNFIVFTHSSGESILCYPTILNSIKLESLDTIINEVEKEVVEIKLNKDVFNQEKRNYNNIDHNSISTTSYPKVTNRDKYLVLKLNGHSAKIVDLCYYQVGSNSKKGYSDDDYQNKLKNDKKDVQNRTLNSNKVNIILNENKESNFVENNNLYKNEGITDYLITSSEDRTIKIWNISNLNLGINNINLNNQNNYTSPLLKTLIHQHSIVQIQIFFNPLKDVKENLEIVSMSYGDKIRVYDLRNFHMRKDVTPITSANYDTQFTLFNLEKSSNYLVTANHLNNIRIWDYEISKVLFTVNYSDSKVIKLINLSLNDVSTENVLIIDDKGNNATINVVTQILSKLNCKYKSNRSSVCLVDENNVLFGCKNGTIHRFCFDSLKVEEEMDIFKGISQNIPVGVTCIVHFSHHKYKSLIFCHYQNQKLYIYS